LIDNLQHWLLTKEFYIACRPSLLITQGICHAVWLNFFAKSVGRQMAPRANQYNPSVMEALAIIRAILPELVISSSLSCSMPLAVPSGSG